MIGPSPSYFDFLFFFFGVTISEFGGLGGIVIDYTMNEIGCNYATVVGEAVDRRV
jgi:hypothetical protein